MSTHKTIRLKSNPGKKIVSRQIINTIVKSITSLLPFEFKNVYNPLKKLNGLLKTAVQLQVSDVGPSSRRPLDNVVYYYYF